MGDPSPSASAYTWFVRILIVVSAALWLSTLWWSPTWLSPSGGDPYWLMVLFGCVLVGTFIFSIRQKRRGRSFSGANDTTISLDMMRRTLNGLALIALVVIPTVIIDARNGWFGWSTDSPGDARRLRVDNHGDVRVVPRDIYDRVVANNTRFFLAFIVVLCIMVLLSMTEVPRDARDGTLPGVGSSS